ncbi:dihydroneopterin aldolase [Phormidium yuhuli AB48]|uniref:7,8-dihydroneopterin aldolase n=1 Tax=Phormidium yuhuli AB48 TaxID=2940671 RepID=A0ABY5AQ73_9CYAN|nr:dihydroneopterin aldolase [Phormidium yuhuli]USR91363.1 dihydroneopterin aldolase [Phormidium yuhuli AB48]
MDSIELSQIRCYGYTGLLPEEQVLGQWFEVDLTLWLDLHKASASDVIDDTLDYRQAIAQVKEIIKTEKFALVERLAGAIADRLLTLEKVQHVRVRLSKPAAPIPDFGGRITIDITRPTRQEA